MTAPGQHPDPGPSAAPDGPDLPVARVAVDTGVAHLDRPFDYRVTGATAHALPGCRVRVRFAGRLVDGVVLERLARTDHDGTLATLHAVVSSEPVLTPQVAALARAVADRYVGALVDVLRLALPPRHARVEKEPPPEPAPDPAPFRADDPDQVGRWALAGGGADLLTGLAAGAAPRVVWGALPGPQWPTDVALAVRAVRASGRGAVVVLPDARDVARVLAALAAVAVPAVELRADLGPAARYRAFLRLRRGSAQVVVGTRSAAFAPVHDLGLVLLWDDGDDLHAEPRAPYPHAREVLLTRAHLEGAAVVLGGHARTAEAAALLDRGWATAVVPDRAAIRAAAPRVQGTSEDDLARDEAARTARVPARAFAAARAALAAGRPVLVQVPRRGWSPSLACREDRTPARCSACGGPLALGSSQGVAACRWCGRPAADWRCPVCDGQALRSSVVGAGRTAEELGRAFPGVAVRTSGRDAVLAEVPAAPALVVCTPGAEPVVTGGSYGAVLLLDGWALLQRPDLRAGEEALRRWLAAAALAAPAAEGGEVVVVADQGLPAVQALVRWDPVWAAARELAERTALHFPPAARVVAVTGSAPAVGEVTTAVVRRLAGLQPEARPVPVEVLGPVPEEVLVRGARPTPDEARLQRALLRVPRTHGTALGAALRAELAVRSARKQETVRVQVDPTRLL